MCLPSRNIHDNFPLHFLSETLDGPSLPFAKSPRAVKVPAMEAAVAPPWSIRCKACDRHLAASSHVAFLQENEQSVHLKLKRELLKEHDEHASETQRHPRTILRSHIDSGQGVNVVRVRTAHVGKRARCPFELICPKCSATIGSESIIGQNPHVKTLVLSSKACVWVSVQCNRQNIRKWSVILRELKSMKMEVDVQHASVGDNQAEPCASTTQHMYEPIMYPTEQTIAASFVPHGKLTPLRSYQKELVISALLENTIVYLPTGCGKTLVAIKVMDEIKRLNQDRLAVFFVPTGPLVSQQAAYIRRESDLRVIELSGQHTHSELTFPWTRSKKRKQDGFGVDVIVVTPQFFINMLFASQFSLKSLCIMVFDEAHHAVQGHPYREIMVKVMLMDHEFRPRILALTASPFGETGSIHSGQSALDNLTLSFGAALNTPTISELATNANNKEVQWVDVEPSAFEIRLKTALKQYVESHYDSINVLSGGRTGNFFRGNFDTSDVELCNLLARLREKHEGAQKESKHSDLDLVLAQLRAIASSFQQFAVHGPHSVANQVKEYFSMMDKRTFDLVAPMYRAHLLPTLSTILLENDGSSKISARVRLIADSIRNLQFGMDSRAIVFVRRRRTAIDLAKAMEDVPDLRELNPTRFVGHNSYEGMSWEEEQKPTLERFRQGRIRLLVATNVIEEGLDIPQCSLVIQFDGVTGLTSLIQSRGRTRQQKSTFIIFCSPTGKERQQRIVENESNMLQVARLEALKLPSKKIVERIIMNSSSSDPTDTISSNNESACSFSGGVPRPNGFSDQDSDHYSIRLGNFFTHNSRFRTSVLRLLNHHCNICFVDQRLGLCTVQASRSEDMCDSYLKLCEKLHPFIVEDYPFWVCLEGIYVNHRGIDSSIDFSEVRNLTLSRLENGFFFPSTVSFAVSSPSSTTWMGGGTLEIIGNAISVSFDHYVVNFDLRALCESTVWMDTTSCEGFIAVYIAFRSPPQVYRDSLRHCVDCQHQPLTYRFLIDVASSENPFWRVRQFFVKLGIEVRSTCICIGESRIMMEPKKCMVERPTLPFRVVYALECLASRCSHFAAGFDSPTFYDTLLGLNSAEQEAALLGFDPVLTGDQIEFQFREYVETKRSVFNGISKNSSQAVVFKVIVTPTRMMFYPPMEAPSNRVFRNFGSDKFMYVYFRDENLDRLDFTDVMIAARVMDVMQNGIYVGNVCGTIGGQNCSFQFLGCSLSQVRNNSCIFTLLDPLEIREWVGDLSPIQSPAKYLKRLSQAFSSTKEAFKLNQSVLVNPVDDVENAGYVFTDGCGEISTSGANCISAILGLPFTPSAFQIRLGGAKGVVVVSASKPGILSAIDSEEPETCIVLRKSMCKFFSRYAMLEIVATSGPSIAFLTRQSIQLLSALGIPDKIFLSMQDEYLKDLATMIASDSDGFVALKGVLPPKLCRWIDVYMRQQCSGVFVDGFLFSMVVSMYQYRLENTVMRARVPIAKARSLMGVADFTGTLSYGEVFVQYSERDVVTNEFHTIVLDGVDVIVHRSPCHHPGDIRFLRCRADVPTHLRQLTDCIVFPCHGSRPHPDECTGGDLDGDIFTVIWDERLIPSKQNIVEPMTFDIDDPPECNEVIDDRGLIQFYIESIKNDILGVASNAHLAICDSAGKGCFDGDALELARICSRQVDSRQTEKHMSIVRRLSPKIYPDFMQNIEKGSYPSEKVLGQMYRRCKSLLETTASNCSTASNKMDDDFLVPGYDLYLDQAKNVYRQYTYEIRALLRMSGATSDADLATGMIVHPESIYRADYFRHGDNCKDSFYRLQERFRSRFGTDYGKMEHTEMRKVAAAWYFVAYSDVDSPCPFYSFPWVMFDILVVNKEINLAKSPRQRPNYPVDTSCRNETISRLQIHLLDELRVQKEELMSEMFDRQLAVSSLQSTLSPFIDEHSCYRLVLFGSSALMTFEKQSDLDVMIYHTKNRNINLKKISQQLSGLKWEVEYRHNARIPILSFSHEKWSVDLGCAPNGPLKTWLFRAYMERYRFFWPCLFVLLRWGKCFGVIRRRSGGGDELIPPIGFIWFFIGFCQQKNYISWIDPDTITMNSVVQDYSVHSEDAFWTERLQQLISNSGNEVLAGSVLLSFWEHFADLSTPAASFSFQDPFDPDNNTQLSTESIAIFRERCYTAVHQVVISRGQITWLLRHHKNHISKITLSRALSRRVQDSQDFFSRKILLETEASKSVSIAFTKHPNALRPDLCVAVITGDGRSVHRIEQYLEKVEQELGSPAARHSNTELYHREGAGVLLFEGAVSQDERLGFQEYSLGRHSQHEYYELHQAHLLCFMNGRQWYDHASADFCKRLLEQMVKLSHFEYVNKDRPHAKAFIRFGHHYLIHLPRSFHAETIARASIRNLEEEFERGRTARQLYESVLMAKKKQRDEDEVSMDGIESVSGNGWSKSDNDCSISGWDDECGDLGWGTQYDREEVENLLDAGKDIFGSNECQSKAPIRRHSMKLQSATAVVKKDKGVTHSFYTIMNSAHLHRMEGYATEHLRFEKRDCSKTVQASMVYDSLDFTVLLTHDLEFVKLKTRATRWFSATLKMRQELEEDGSKMDSTPDIRYYVSSTEDVSKSHALYQKLIRSCERASNGHGILEFMDVEKTKLRVSEHLLASKEFSSSVFSNVRYVESTSYQCPDTEMKFRVMNIREYTIPSVTAEKGYLGTITKSEVEFAMPPLTTKMRLNPTFARQFFSAGVDFVEFLRQHSLV